MSIPVKNKDEIKAMREAGKIVALVIKDLKYKIEPGITTKELDQWAEKVIKSNGALPAFKGYQGYPATLCTSVNNQVVHGIPSDRVLKVGDIIGIDVGAKLGNWYSDTAYTYAVGEVSNKAKKLMEVTKKALEAGIKAAVVGNRVFDIGYAVQQVVEAEKFSVVRDFIGHGIGRALHELPQVPNYADPRQVDNLKEGMFLAIEPMVNAGGYKVRVKEDKWTVETVDGSLSAHFEHTVLVKEGVAEVITQ